ncbi:hypothetical protein POM88_030514 [Heracleum sosnowskyi]|uniref:Uncharacterized protein n=1 Tax=Heracleum sosnowskyi TaxID=360622 RepID=A0AAD8HX39_9APIA|nr:hypothetical protein POM88_030514 [Heracleum sosnowskyi]
MEIYDTSRNIGIYEPMHQMSMWVDMKSNGFLNTSTSMLVEVETKLDNQSEDTSHETLGHSNKCIDFNGTSPKILCNYPCVFPAIYNFGDSNSDTGGISAAFLPIPNPDVEVS